VVEDVGSEIMEQCGVGVDLVAPIPGSEAIRGGQLSERRPYRRTTMACFRLSMWCTVS
jgi:hypothetical protein